MSCGRGWWSRGEGGRWLGIGVGIGVGIGEGLVLVGMEVSLG